jgi:hypothetical protein
MRLLARNEFVCHSLRIALPRMGPKFFGCDGRTAKVVGCSQFKPARIAFALRSLYAVIASCLHQPAFRWLATVFV